MIKVPLTKISTRIQRIKSGEGASFYRVYLEVCSSDGVLLTKTIIFVGSEAELKQISFEWPNWAQDVFEATLASAAEIER